MNCGKANRGLYALSQRGAMPPLLMPAAAALLVNRDVRAPLQFGLEIAGPPKTAEDRALFASVQRHTAAHILGFHPRPWAIGGRDKRVIGKNVHIPFVLREAGEVDICLVADSDLRLLKFFGKLLLRPADYPDAVRDAISAGAYAAADTGGATARAGCAVGRWMALLPMVAAASPSGLAGVPADGTWTYAAIAQFLTAQEAHSEGYRYWTAVNAYLSRGWLAQMTRPLPALHPHTGSFVAEAAPLLADTPWGKPSLAMRMRLMDTPGTPGINVRYALTAMRTGNVDGLSWVTALPRYHEANISKDLQRCRLCLRGVQADGPEGDVPHLLLDCLGDRPAGQVQEGGPSQSCAGIVRLRVKMMALVAEHWRSDRYGDAAVKAFRALPPLLQAALLAGGSPQAVAAKVAADRAGLLSNRQLAALRAVSEEARARAAGAAGFLAAVVFNWF